MMTLWLSRLGLAVLVLGTAFGLGYWRGHVAGASNGVTQVATLQAHYASAQAKAVHAAAAQQAQADADALQAAAARARASEQAAASARDGAERAMSRLAVLRQQLAREARADASVDAWMATPLPPGVQEVLNAAD